MAEIDKKLSYKWMKGLEKEVPTWVQEGIISDVQAGAILQRYWAAREEEEREQGSRLVTVLAVMGVLLLGVGVILFFAANWQVMPKWLKVALVFASIIAAYGTGYYLAFEKQNYPRVGRSLIFLGSILYGSGIWLIAQIFHISSHYPNGVLFWAIGIIPVVVVCGSLSVLLQASLLLTLWTILEQTGFQNSNYLYLALVTAIMLLSYRMRSRLAVGLTLPGIAIWMGIASAVSFDDHHAIIYIFLLTALYGIAVYALGNVQYMIKKFSDMKLPYQITGMLLFFLSLFILSFRELTRVLYDGNIKFPVFFVVTFIVVALCTLGLGVYMIMKSKDNNGLLKEGLFSMATSVFIITLALTAFLMNDTVFFAATNILLFICVIAVTVIGYLNREPVLINFGLIFFVLDIIARYFDFFWDMLPKSVFFMAGGLLLLVGGTLLERNRRKIIRGMKVKNYAA